MQNKADYKWNCASYSRLSREDLKTRESNSIINQKELIREYIKSTPEIRLSLEIEDDGFSGVDFSRPGFEKLMEEIKKGNINCIVVKDLSRFGRNYIEVGNYLDKIFPFLGVRFIAINDDYDSSRTKTSSDEIIVPFKNLVNDAYIQDISIKIRSQFDIKRKKGEYIGAFAPYGYIKDPKNKNKLIPDEYVALVIRQQFKWKVEGYSNNGIAKLLNDRREKTPYDYRSERNDNYSTPFKQKAVSKWTSKTVGRILSNPLYIGHLVQGKVTTPNHKVKKPVVKPQEEWIVTKNTHEAIIEQELFDIVQNLNSSDTRVGKNSDKVHLFSGMAICGDCGSPMGRKIIPTDGKNYNYLICIGHKTNKNCSLHYFNENKLANIVLSAIKLQISSILEAEKILNKMSSRTVRQNQTKLLSDKLMIVEDDIAKKQQYKMNLYENMIEKIISLEEYEEFNAIYFKKIEHLEIMSLKLKEELKNSKTLNNLDTDFIERIKKHKDVKEISRSLVVSMIKEIIIYEDNKIEIEFLYKDKYTDLLAIVATKHKEKVDKIGEI